MQRYRVVQWSTGNIGKQALGILLDRNAFDVVGVHALGARQGGAGRGDAGRPRPRLGWPRPTTSTR